ncbi:MAG: fatty acid desaturase [Deltaproteobacteria bacterium]|nr:fatty acid desaturase [Deltaproteobacteria bacterium]
MAESPAFRRQRAVRSPLRRVFRHPIDVVPAALITAVSAAQIAIFLGISAPLHVLACTALLFPLQVNFAGMCHNHHHIRTFRQPILNRVFEVMMFFQLGMLPYVYTLHHNLGHHRHYLDQQRDSNRWRRRDGGTMGSWEFAWVLAVNIYPVACRIGRDHPIVFRRFRRMAGVCAIVLACLIIASPVNALLVFALPLPLALVLQAQATHYHHAGLDARDHWHASRSATARLYNLRTFNLGYHTAHHLRPMLHWSKLPAFHATIAHAIPRDLVI